MAQPLTWKNISIPNISVGQAAMGKLAQNSLTSAANSLTGLLDAEKEQVNDNWDLAKQSQTDDVLARIKGMDDVIALDKLAADPSSLTEPYGVQIDKSAIAAALTKQHTSAQDDLIGSAVSNLSNQNLTNLERRTNINNDLLSRGIAESDIPGLTEQIMKRSTGKREDIATSVIKTNTDDYLAQTGWDNPTTARALKAQAVAKFGKNVDTSRFDARIQSAESNMTEDLMGNVQNFAQQHGSFDDILDYVTNVPDIPSDIRDKVFKQVERMYAPTASAKQKQLLYGKIAANKMEMGYQKTMQPRRDQLVAAESKLELYAPAAELEKLGVSALVGGGKAGTSGIEQELIANQPGTFWNFFRDTISDKDVRSTFNALKDEGVSSKAAAGIILQLGKSGIITDGSFGAAGNKVEAFKKEANRLAAEWHQYQDSSKKVATLRAFISNNDSQFKLDKQGQELQYQLGAIGSRHPGATSFKPYTFSGGKNAVPATSETPNTADAAEQIIGPPEPPVDPNAPFVVPTPTVANSVSTGVQEAASKILGAAGNNEAPAIEQITMPSPKLIGQPEQVSAEIAKASERSIADSFKSGTLFKDLAGARKKKTKGLYLGDTWAKDQHPQNALEINAVKALQALFNTPGRLANVKPQMLKQIEAFLTSKSQYQKDNSISAQMQDMISAHLGGNK